MCYTMNRWLFTFLATIVFVGVTSYNGVCYPKRQKTYCRQDETCLNTNPTDGYGMCRKNSEICERSKGARCRYGKKCLMVDESLGINICIEDKVFCKINKYGCPADHRCFITDKARREGICVKNTRCLMVADAPDDADCPRGYRCCFDKFMSGVCMKGNLKDFFPQCSLG